MLCGVGSGHQDHTTHVQNQECESQVNMPNVNTYLNMTPSICEWHVVNYGFTNGHQKGVFKFFWTIYSKYLNHSRFNNYQHNWGRERAKGGDT